METTEIRVTQQHINDAINNREGGSPCIRALREHFGEDTCSVGFTNGIDGGSGGVATWLYTPDEIEHPHRQNYELYNTYGFGGYRIRLGLFQFMELYYRCFKRPDTQHLLKPMTIVLVKNGLEWHADKKR